MVLGGQPPGRVGRRRFFLQRAALRGGPFSFQGSIAPQASIAFNPAAGEDRDVTTQIRPTGVEALALIDQIATGIGPRRPCSSAERQAAELLRARLEAAGLDARLEEFPSLQTFGLPQGAVLGTALLAGAMPPRWRFLRAVTAAKAAVLGALDANFSRWGPSRLLARETSTNLVAEVPATGEEKRTLCLVGHLDSSRSGLMFHPAITPHLGGIVGAVGAALAVQGGEGVLGRWSLGRRLVSAARLLIAAALALVLEREIRGEDVAGRQRQRLRRRRRRLARL